MKEIHLRFMECIPSQKIMGNSEKYKMYYNDVDETSKFFHIILPFIYFKKYLLFDLEILRFPLLIIACHIQYESVDNDPLISR